MIRALLAALLLSAFTQVQIDSIQEVGVVRVQYVQTGDYDMQASEVARAVRTSDGLRYILINLDADLADMDGWYWHEMAHHVAWERYGENIAPHGPEFRTVCRDLVRQRTAYFCDGD